MSDFLTKYVGTYRVLPELCTDTNDFPRDCNGCIDKDTGTYIHCYYGNQIYYWGKDDEHGDILVAYIQTIGRGRNVMREMKRRNIDFFDYDEFDSEVTFKFRDSDIGEIADMLKARTAGASIPPFSPKNLPVNKSVEIPQSEIDRYSDISSRVDMSHMSLFKSWNKDFLENVLQKKMRRETKNRKYDYKADMKKQKMSRQTKEFIYASGCWDEYISHLKKCVDEAGF